MLSDQKLIDAFMGKDGIQTGLRAVEAAVRADVAREVRMIPCWVNTEEGTSEFDISGSHRDAVLAAIRAQLPAIVSEPSTPEQPEGETR